MVSESPPASDAVVRTVPLCQLRAGERARVHTTELACEDCELLRAMGMTEHCRLKVCRSGGTCIVQVKATRLGLSGAIARRIMVAIETPPAAHA